MENFFWSQFKGMNSSSTAGNDSLQYDLLTFSSVGCSRATMDVSFGPLLMLGSAVGTNCCWNMKSRSDSKCGSVFTCSSERSRYRPGEIIHNHADRGSEPLSHGKRSQRCLGSGMRLPSGSNVTCATSAAGFIGSSVDFRNLPVHLFILSFVFCMLRYIVLTFTGFYRTIPDIVGLHSEQQDVVGKMRIYSRISKQKANMRVKPEYKGGLL